MYGVKPRKSTITANPRLSSPPANSRRLRLSSSTVSMTRTALKHFGQLRFGLRGWGAAEDEVWVQALNAKAAVCGND